MYISSDSTQDFFIQAETSTEDRIGTDPVRGKKDKRRNASNNKKIVNTVYLTRENKNNKKKKGKKGKGSQPNICLKLVSSCGNLQTQPLNLCFSLDLFGFSLFDYLCCGATKRGLQVSLELERIFLTEYRILSSSRIY